MPPVLLEYGLVEICPPQITIFDPVQIAVCEYRAEGQFVPIEVAVQ